MKADPFTDLSPEEKNQLQLERLQSTLNRAGRHVPFHRQRLAAKGLEPGDIETLSDIEKLPFLDRADFSEHYPYDLFAVPLHDIVRIHTAPGTARNPTVSGYTAQDLEAWQNMVGRALTAAGLTRHDILQIALHPGLANWGRDYKDSAQSMGISVIPNTLLSIEKQCMVLRDYKTTVIVTTPAVATHLAEAMDIAGISPAALSLHTLILVGETIADNFRKDIEARLHVTSWLHYGLSEVPGPAVGFECERHNGLHINEDHFLAEIVDPESGIALPAGHTGELVLTTLTTRAFPLIRFKTGQRAKMFQDTCPCGRALAKIDWFAERTDAVMNIDGVNVHGRQVGGHLEQILPISAEHIGFDVIHREGRKCLEVWLPMHNTIFSDEIKELEKLLRKTENTLRENLGVPVIIRLIESKSR
ncbi:MAG: phenylacetate--CoA ligase family protein [Thermodesulfobacteriota bacterium]